MLHNCSVLIVDDEEVMRDVLESLLVREGCRVRLAASGEEAIEAAEAESLDVAIVDVMLPDINGIEVLERLKSIDPELPVVMITAFGTAANTREAFKRGAFDFIEKPFKNDEVLVVLRNAVEQHRLVTENRTLRQSLKLQGHRFSELVGRSSRMQRVFDLVTQAAPTRTTILIQGEALGVNSGNVTELAAGNNVKVKRLLGTEGAWGQSDLGLETTVAQTVISQVGNYGEIYERHLGASGIGLPREGGRNALWSGAPCTDCPKGGQIYAPPLR